MKTYLRLTLLLLIILSACSNAVSDTTSTATSDTSAAETDQQEASPEATSLPATGAPATDTAEPDPTVAIEATEIVATNEPEGDAEKLDEVLSDAEVNALMYQLTSDDLQEGLDALTAIDANGDIRFVPVLIDAMRFGQIGVAPSNFRVAMPVVLEGITGETIGNNWEGWVEWYGTTDIEPPTEFVPWKGEMMSRIDPNFAQFFDPDFEVRLRPEEIQWGGVRLDGIPALDQAEQISAETATWLNPQDVVFGISLNGDSRAYPLRILDWHEMANDVVGGVPVSLAYCTLCGAAIAWDGRGADGTDYDFGSSGFLYRSNKLMYDRQTHTIWNQMTGEPVLGVLSSTDLQLDHLPVVMTTWEQWQETHPDTTVLAEDTGFNRDYTAGAAYARYFSSPELMFPVPLLDDAFEPKSHVYGLTVNDVSRAWPIDTVAEETVINDSVDDLNVVVVGERGKVSVLQNDSEAAWYSTGAEVRVFARGDQTFTPSDEADVLLDESGERWQVTEEGLVSESGETAERVAGHLAYWFGWKAFFPETTVYGLE